MCEIQRDGITCWVDFFFLDALDDLNVIVIRIDLGG